MFRLFNRSKFYAAPDTTGGTGGNQPPTGTSKEDVIEFLGADDEPEVINLDTKTIPKDKTDKKEKEEVKEIKEETEVETDEEETDLEDELRELEEELEGPKDEQLDLVTPVRRKEILKKYPQLFKDFPYLETAYYREQAFTQVFPTIDEAKEASSKATTLDRFEKDLMGGNTETILKAVSSEDPKAFSKIVDDYLPTLARVNEQAYHHVIGNTIKHTIIAMVGEAKRSNNEALQNAAALVNQFVFGTSEFTPPKNLSKDTPEDKTKDDTITKREQDFTRRQFESSQGDLNTRVNNSLKATIEANIDPKDSMTDYVKRNASREALETVTSLIEKDSRFKALLDRMWDQAFKSNFDKTSTDRIRAAYISKAKSLLPSVIKKARIDALKGMGKKVKEEKEEEPDDENQETRTRRSTARTSEKEKEERGPRRTGKITKASEIPKGMRSIDFLMSDD